MEADQVPAVAAQLLVPTYARPDVVFTRGVGSKLYDSRGKEYIDFAAGIAVSALGHADPGWQAALSEQAAALDHVSNLFHSAPQVELARRLTAASFADRVFFSNSGSEANEAALKFSRKWARSQHDPDKTHVVAFEHSFHGRTMGALSLTEKARYREPFSPLVPDVTFIPLNDLRSLREAVTDRTCSVFIEPLQGEGGVRPAELSFLRALRDVCDQHQALLVFDEVQCGLGRTGSLWAHEASGVMPDVMTLAKPLAGGLPIGATLVTEDVARTIEVGDHGSTFGGGPLACAVACYVFDRISDPDLLAQVSSNGRSLREQLNALPSDYIMEVRGEGLLIGVEFSRPVKPLMQRALGEGLVVINAGENVLRICPPLTIEPDEIDQGISILTDSLQSLDASGSRG
jgi:predicted acetylornithine/succinylornithine family transaminase